MRKTFINLVSVIGGEFLLRGASFLSIVVIARLYGAALLGIYATVIAYVTVATLAADNGLQTCAVTELAAGVNRKTGLVTALYITKTALLVPAFVVIVAVFVAHGLSTIAWTILGYVVARQFLQSFGQLQMAILKSLDRMIAIGVIQAVECIFLLTGIGAVYFLQWPINRLLLWLVCGQMLELLLSLACIVSTGLRFGRVGFDDCYLLARRATPVGVTYGLAGFILRMDVIVLSLYGSSAVIGHFAAAHVLLVLVYVVGWLLGTVLLPDMVRLSASGNDGREYVGKWSSVLFFATIPLSVLILATAPQLTPWLYGNEFLETGRILAVLALAFPFILNNSLYFHRAVAMKSTGTFLGVYIGTAVTGFCLSILSAMRFGAIGVATAIVVREAGMFLTFKLLSRRGQYVARVAEVCNEN